jgi:hypothetical protein
MGLALGYYLEDPGSGPKWKLRMNFVLLLLRASPAVRRADHIETEDLA